MASWERSVYDSLMLKCKIKFVDPLKARSGVVFAVQAVEPYFPAAAGGGGLEQENEIMSMKCRGITKSLYVDIV